MKQMWLCLYSGVTGGGGGFIHSDACWQENNDLYTAVCDVYEKMYSVIAQCEAENTFHGHTRDISVNCLAKSGHKIYNMTN